MASSSTSLCTVVVVMIGLLYACSLVQAASLTEVTSFGDNPGGLRMFVYKPASAKASGAPILAAPQYCGGGATGAQSWYKFDTLADQYGFIIVYPQNNHKPACFDATSPDTLAHDAGGDSLSIANMVRYALKTYNGDKSRVFVTGFSSGAVITHVMCAVYPDLFAAGAEFAGIPAGCSDPSVTNARFNTTCDSGKIQKTGAEWKASVQKMYAGYTGPYPRIQLWHGVKDELVNFQNHKESIKMWTAIHGVSETPVQTDANVPSSGWTRTRYGTKDDHPVVEATEVATGTHAITFQTAAVVKFFGLDGSWVPTQQNETTPSQCEPNPCGSHGTCVPSGTTNYKCTCKDNYTGAICDTPPKTEDACTSNPCGSHGTCAVSGASFKCTCTGGYTGTACDKAPVDKPSCDVDNGGCDADQKCSVNTDGTIKCTSTSTTDACTSKPCANDGTCTVSGTRYTCACSAAYTGTRCQTAVTTTNKCSSSPCGSNGRCTVSSTVTRGYTCVCNEGYELNTAQSTCVKSDSTDPPIEEPPVEDPPVDAAVNSPSSSNSKNIIIYVLIGVAVLIVIGAVVYYFSTRGYQAVVRLTQVMRGGKDTQPFYGANTNSTAPGSYPPYMQQQPPQQQMQQPQPPMQEMQQQPPQQQQYPNQFRLPPVSASPQY